MTATLDTVAKKKEPVEESAELAAARELVRQAKEQGLSLTGPGGLLKQLTKTVLEAALDEELTEHLGHERRAPAAGANVRNGTRSKTVLTESSGHVEIDVPRDRDGSFEPQIVRKRQRRLSGVDEIVLSLYAKGLTTGEISAHFADIYQASVSKEVVSRITDRVLEEMVDWSVRPLDEVYAAIFIDAIVVKVRDGQVANRPIYAAIGVTLDGERDILGLWAGQGGEGAKFWMSVLTDLRNRGVRDVFFVVCDGLKGLPDVVGNVWPATIVQTCIIHLIRNTFRLTSRRDWDALKRDVRPIYTAVNATAARAAFEQLAETWGHRYPAIVRLWDNAWNEFIPFLDYDIEIRRVLCSTNAIESLNARYRRAIKARGHFPSEQAALKCLYLASLRSRSTVWLCRWRSAHRVDGSDTKTACGSGDRRVRPGERSATTILIGDSGRDRAALLTAIIGCSVAARSVRRRAPVTGAPGKVRRDAKPWRRLVRLSPFVVMQVIAVKRGSSSWLSRPSQRAPRARRSPVASTPSPKPTASVAPSTERRSAPEGPASTCPTRRDHAQRAGTASSPKPNRTSRRRDP